MSFWVVSASVCRSAGLPLLRGDSRVGDMMSVYWEEGEREKGGAVAHSHVICCISHSHSFSHRLEELELAIRRKEKEKEKEKRMVVCVFSLEGREWLH